MSQKDRARRIADVSGRALRDAHGVIRFIDWQGAAVLLPRPMWRKKVTPFAVTSLMTGALVGATVWTLTPDPPRLSRDWP